MLSDVQHKLMVAMRFMFGETHRQKDAFFFLWLGGTGRCSLADEKVVEEGDIGFYVFLMFFW